MVQLNFDATQVAPDMGREVVPAGWYNIAMDESEMKPTKDGLGAYLNCRFNILDGQFAGRKLFTLINVKNANAQAVEIAFRELSAIAHAVGVLHVGDSSQLHNLPMKAKVKIEKDKTGEYEDNNRITMYKNINEVVDQPKGATTPAASSFVPPPAAPAMAPPPPAPPAGPSRPADPAHIHAPGTPGEMWWINGAWTPAIVAPVAPPAAPAAPEGWAGGTTQPWSGAPAPAGFAAPPTAGPAGQPGMAAPPAPAAPAAPATAPTAPPPWAQPPA